MIFSISIKQSAVKSLEKIPGPDRLRIIKAIDLLKEHPGAGSILKGEFSGVLRIWVGMYLVLYEIQGNLLTILVIRINHRRDVYR